MDTPVNETQKLGKIVRGTLRWSIYLAFFSVPLFFLPWTTSVLELNKQILFVFLAALALVAWLGSMVVEKQITFRRSWLNLFPLIFIVVALFSSIFSLAGYTSWVGAAAQEYTSFLSLGMFSVFFYVLMHMREKSQVQRYALFSLFLSTGISSLIVLLGVFDLVHLPFAFTQAPAFNPIGTMIGFATFTSIVMILGVALWMVGKGAKYSLFANGIWENVTKGAIALIVLANLIISIAISFWMVWILNIVGIAVLAGFMFMNQENFPKNKLVALPFLILIVSIIFLAVGIIFEKKPINLPLPAIVSPSYGVSWDIAQETVTSSIPRFIWGSGPGTFIYDYSLYRPENVNQSQLFSLRFDRAKSHALTVLTTMGVIGLLSWLALMGYIASKAIGQLISRRQDSGEWKMTYALFSGWVVAFLAHILYSSNFSLSFILVGLSGLLAAQIAGTLQKSSFGRSPRLGLLASFGFVLLLVATIGVVFISAQRYRAEVAFANAVRIDESDQGLQETIIELSRTIQINPYADHYQRNLASALIFEARNLIAALPEDRPPESLNQVKGLIGAAINAANAAVQIEPNSVVNYETQGLLFREIMGFAEGADIQAITAFEKAIELEPLSPIHHTNLGRVYIGVADRFAVLKGAEDEQLVADAIKREEEALAKAEAALNRSVELKADYGPGHFYLAAVFERQGRLEDAAKRLGALRQLAPLDTTLGFQFAMMLLRLDEIELAGAELQRIVGIDQEFSNARWFLSAVYEQLGEIEAAIKQVEIVEQLNPENELVQQRLDQLRNGQVTSNIPPPVEEGEETVTDVPDGEFIEDESAEVSLDEIDEEEPSEEAAE